MTKTLNKLGIEGNSLNLIKKSNKPPTVIIFNGEKPEAFPLILGTKARMFSLTIPFQNCTGSYS